MKTYYTESDAGAVRIGNADFTALVNNNYGDGSTGVHILDRGEKVPEEAHFEMSIRGTNINIYKYDCGGDGVVTQLTGRFGIYVSCMNVYFEPWKEW